jgi:hypothetical protein
MYISGWQKSSLMILKIGVFKHVLINKQEAKHLFMFINFWDNLGLMLLLLIHEK